MSVEAFPGPQPTRSYGSVREISRAVDVGAIVVACVALVLAVLPAVALARSLPVPTYSGRTAPSAVSHGAPASIPAGLQEAIHRALGPGPIGLGMAPQASGFEASSSGWSALAPRQGLSATVSPSGALRVFLTGTGPKGLIGSLAPRAVSAGGPAAALRVTSSSLVGARLVQKMGPVSTWYEVTPAGIEQGFTIYRAFGSGGGDLVIDLGASAGWAVAANSSALVEKSPDGISLVYGDLKVTDAKGTLLRSQLAVVHGTVQIVALPGRATVYPIYVDPTWSSPSSPTATLTNSGGASGDELGWSVALSADGTTALIGALDVGAHTGAAYVFHVSNEGSWSSSSSPTAILTNSGGAPGDHFGWSVALSADGTTALIGAPSVSSGTGAAYVFHVSNEGSWSSSSSPTATFTNSGGAPGDELGWSVALSADGTTALIAAEGAGSGTGAAYVFHVSNEGSWATSSAPTATLTNSGGAPGDYFGSSVALSADGTIALIGALRATSPKGAAYVFHVSNEGSWATSSAPTATLTNSGAATGNNFGSSVALSADGTTALIGADGVGSLTGAAYVFHVSSEGSWATSSAPTATLTNSASASRDLFGSWMALSADGTTALIGAEGAGSGAGAAYIFHVSNEGSWATSSAPTATLTSSGGYFGSSVVLSADGTTALIGALGASSAKGAAYVFHVSGSASSPPATFAGSYRFSYRYYNNGAMVSAGNEAIGFGTDGHWTMSACTDTGTYSYDRLTDTVAFTDTTDSAHGLPSYTWVGRPSTGFTGLMASTAGGSYTDERGTAVATPSPPSSCSVPTSPGAAKEAPRVAQYPAGVGPAAGNGAQPEELAVGPDGNLWYTDEVSGVFRFSPTTLVPLACSSASPTVGNLGCEVSADPVAPNDIVAAPDGAMWFTQSAGGNPKGGASYFPASIGRITPTGSYSSYPVPASASSVPGLDAITVGPNGNLWFTEPAVGRIGEVTPRAAGPVVHEFALPAADRLAQGVGSPVTSADTIAAGLGGDIWFTEQGSNAIGVMATSGALLHKFTVPNPNSNPAPLGITEGPDKTMWFTENGANQVASITAQGKVTLYALPAAADGPESIVYGPDGNFWFTDNTGAARIDPSTGKVTLYRAHAASLGPAGVTVGPDCTSVWFTEPGADRLGRVSPVPNTTGCKAGAVPVP